MLVGFDDETFVQTDVPVGGHGRCNVHSFHVLRAKKAKSDSVSTFSEQAFCNQQALSCALSSFPALCHRKCRYKLETVHKARVFN